MYLPALLQLFNIAAMSLGSRVRAWRTFYGWTLDELAGRSGVERGTIGAMEIRSSKRSEHGPALAKAFGIAYEQLLDEKFAPSDAIGELAKTARQVIAETFEVDVDEMPVRFSLRPPDGSRPSSTDPGNFDIEARIRATAGLGPKSPPIDAKPAGQVDEAVAALGILSKFMARLVGLPREVAATALRYLLEDPADPARLAQVQQQLEQLQQHAPSEPKTSNLPEKSPEQARSPRKRDR